MAQNTVISGFLENAFFSRNRALLLRHVINHGASSSLTLLLIETCLRAGITPVVFDASGEQELSDTLTVSIAIAAMLPLQNFVIGFAQQRVEHVAEPRFSSKVMAE